MNRSSGYMPQINSEKNIIQAFFLMSLLAVCSTFHLVPKLGSCFKDRNCTFFPVLSNLKIHQNPGRILHLIFDQNHNQIEPYYNIDSEGIVPTLSTSKARKKIPTKVPIVGEPQKIPEKEYNIDTILKELSEIQRQGPKNYCILGTRHCTFLHQQIIELLAYALVLGGNHVFTSGAVGTNAATIRGALRAERPDLLTVVLPQSLSKQSAESQDLLRQVKNVLSSPQNDHLRLDVASRLCNSDILSRVDQLICFAFHDSYTIIETAREARALDMIVTELYLDRGTPDPDTMNSDDVFDD